MTPSSKMVDRLKKAMEFSEQVNKGKSLLFLTPGWLKVSMAAGSTIFRLVRIPATPSNPGSRSEIYGVMVCPRERD